MKEAALLLAMTMTACSDGTSRGHDGVTVVEGRSTSRKADVAEIRPVLKSTRAAISRPVAVATPSTSIETPTLVHGDATERPLPPELAHLNGLGATSEAEERIP